MTKKMPEFTGVPASPGNASAQTFIISNPMDPGEMPSSDYIIVVEYTTPILNSLIMNAKGVVCSLGGMNMHAAIICRELKIPCVVGVKDIHKTIMSGQLIQIDGTIGSITYK